MSNTQELNFCNSYSVLPSLKDSKTDFDKKQTEMYCQAAQSQEMGPMGNYIGRKVKPDPSGVPPRFLTLGSAYDFRGNLPTPIDRNYRGQ